MNLNASLSWPSEFTIETHHFNRFQLPKEWLEHAYKNKWFKPFVSEELGGLNCTITEGLEILIFTNTIFGGLGWSVNLGAGANYFSGFFDDKGAQQIFTNSNSVLAGSGNIADVFNKAEGGYLASGKGKKATGSTHATHFTFNGELDGKTISCVIPKEKVTVLQDWELFGLKASSSFGYTFKDVFIPEEHTFEIDKIKGNIHCDVHKIPFDLFAKLCMSAAAIGLANGVLQEAKTIPTLQVRIKKSLATLTKLLTKLEDELLTLANQTHFAAKNNQPLPSNEVDLLIKSVGKQLFQAVNALYYDAGLIMADEKQVLHHKYKDFMLGVQHFLLK